MGDQTSDYESQPAFFLGDRAFTVDEVFDAAHFRGELQGCWRELLQALACVAGAASEGLEPDAGQLQGLSEEFRYTNDLVTAEETEGWLNARGISNEAFEDFFLRNYWMAQNNGGTKASTRPLTSASPDERELLRVHTLMSGDLIGMARRLGQREAVRLAAGQNQTPDSGLMAEQRNRLEARLKGSGEDIDSLLCAVRRGPDWLEDQLCLEALFSHGCRQKVTPERLNETLSQLRLQLITIDYEVMEVDTHHVAREVYLNLTLDGMSMEEIADECRLPYHRTRSYLEKLPEALQQAFISSAPGTVIPPGNDQLKVIRLNSKTDPSLEDAKINQYIHRRIINDYLGDLESKHIRWVLK